MLIFLCLRKMTSCVGEVLVLTLSCGQEHAVNTVIPEGGADIRLVVITEWRDRALCNIFITKSHH